MRILHYTRTASRHFEHDYLYKCIPHSASCCASGWMKSTTSASCNWWQPPPAQVERLHQVKEGKYHKHKMQRPSPASALVGTGCSTTCNYNHYHHHHHPDTTSTARCSNQCNLLEGWFDTSISSTLSIHANWPKFYWQLTYILYNLGPRQMLKSQFKSSLQICNRYMNI